MFRIYDNKDKVWIKDGFYLSSAPDSHLYELKKGLFGRQKLEVIDDDRYVIQKSVELIDKDYSAIFEGDIIKAKVENDEIVTGIIAYAHDISAYILLCEEKSMYYTLGNTISNRIKVVGNVFDGIVDDSDVKFDDVIDDDELYGDTVEEK